MTLDDSALRWQRWLVAATLFSSAVLILPAAVEPFMLPKATLAIALAIVLAALGAARAIWSRALAVPSSPVVWGVVAFAVALVITTATSSEPWVSVIGFYGRYTGLAPYLAYLLVFLVVLGVTDLDFVRLLNRTALVALALAVAYGFLQAVDIEPFGFEDNGLGTTFSFFGNVNFSAAWTGALAGLALVSAVDTTERAAWRALAGVLVPLTLGYVLVTETSQGPVVAFLSLVWAGLLLATARGSKLRAIAAERRGVVLLMAGGAVAAVAVAVGAAFPFLRAQLNQSLVERPEFWSAALRIFADNPILGTGLDTYAHHFLAYRPASHALANGLATTDAPHSVPLGMLSNGGLLLFLTHVAVIGTVAVALGRGARRTEGRTRLAVAAWGGVWIGYQVQALISFDVPPLALLHWLSAGLIVACAWPPRWREVTLPGPKPTRLTSRSGKGYGNAVVPTSTHILQGLAALLALVGLWFSAYPLRADLKAASAAPLASSGQFEEAISRFRAASDLNPAEARYPFLEARGQEAARSPQAALAAAEEAARRDPGTVQYALFAARQAQALGDDGLMRRWYQEAVSRDPKDPPVLNEAAAFFARAGDTEAASRLWDRSLALDPDNADALSGLAALRARS